MDDARIFVIGSSPPVAALPTPIEDRSNARFAPRSGGIDLLTVDEVAERCHVSTKTVRRAIDRGELRASRLATRGGWVVRAGDLRRGSICGPIGHAVPRKSPCTTPTPIPVGGRSPDRSGGAAGGRLVITRDMGR